MGKFGFFGLLGLVGFLVSWIVFDGNVKSIFIKKNYIYILRFFGGGGGIYCLNLWFIVWIICELWF